MDHVYCIEQFGRKKPFSSFLPGVAGERGIPLWCFYVNRGQAIAGFGSRDKHHSIMEFCPANTAYQRVQTIGFRTFLKKDGEVIEAFSDGLGEMLIDENALEIKWVSSDKILHVSVRYFIIPNAPVGALARRVTISNKSEHDIDLEVLDGLSAIVPFGLNQHDLKMMGQTAKAWMMVEGLDEQLPYFRLRASLVDTTSVEAIEDGSFGAAFMDGKQMPVIVDPAVVFGWDTSFANPVCFVADSLENLLCKHQRIENEMPCCMFAAAKKLSAGESICIDSLYGLIHGMQQLRKNIALLLNKKTFDKKEHEARNLLSQYTHAIQTHTADNLFDRYCSQSYIDNFLRGGIPAVFRSDEKSRLFYLFSRKHGDLERDYNEFVVTPEYASQGNGNFRDVLQNRRSDVRFCPAAGWQPLKPFLELIQADGYNPLVIQPVSFILRAETLPECTDLCELKQLLEKDFTPGVLLKALEQTELTSYEQERLFNEILCNAEPQVNAEFAEGYWIDHWIYLLDMLENFLSVYPEKKKEVLSERCLRWFESRATVLPLHKRCVATGDELRQYRALDHKRKAGCTNQWMKDSCGQEVLSSALEKFFMLCVIKFASLDPSGEAVSMEAGKPGWYDALNGLPGLFGSSTAESSELWRLLVFVQRTLQTDEYTIQLPSEMAELAKTMADVAELPFAEERWSVSTQVLESYRERTSFGVSSDRLMFSCEDALGIITKLLKCVSVALETLIRNADGPVPTYFTNLPSQWEADQDGIYPTIFQHCELPPFLEGTVHALRLPLDKKIKGELLRKVRNSSLWDEKLRMYKVSADLSAETPELGRANAFTRGWLEHESIWLHMEYKYLLEMLKNGFYSEFFEAFSDVLIPFQPYERYGRSVLENSSFLASSANPDPETHGRGFVARLSGATAEFLEIWQTLFFGIHPFKVKNGLLTLTLSPCIPSRLIPDDGIISVMFLGHTEVIYHLDVIADITPDSYCAIQYQLIGHDDSETIVAGNSIQGTVAEQLRNGKYRLVHVTIAKK